MSRRWVSACHWPPCERHKPAVPPPTPARIDESHHPGRISPRPRTTARAYDHRLSATLSIAVAQPTCVPNDVTTNVAAHAALVRAAVPGCGLPELSLTGTSWTRPPPWTRPTEAVAAGTAAPTRDPSRSSGAGAGRPHRDAVRRWSQATGAYRKVWSGTRRRARFHARARAGRVRGRRDRWASRSARTRGTKHAAVPRARDGRLRRRYRQMVLRRSCKPHAPRPVAADHGVWVAVASFAGATGGGFDTTAGRSAIWAADAPCSRRRHPSRASWPGGLSVPGGPGARGALRSGLVTRAMLGVRGSVPGSPNVREHRVSGRPKPSCWVSLASSG